ncbi:MAG TPA: aminotransferase class IV [Fulvivirga sp.]|nr:aminotransferase class IV [Fulvivirga sp.]
MKVIFNGQLSEETIGVKISNRATQFGDGIFETMIVQNNNIRFFDAHLDRLNRGAKALNLTNELLRDETLKMKIHQLVEANNIVDTCRVKVMLWRQETGNTGYTSNTNKSDALIVVNPSIDPHIRVIDRVAFSVRVFLTATYFSKFKTISALPYVIASIERDEMECDELIITDSMGYVSECISSNVFWITNGRIFTPPLTTGCIEGIMRKQIMALFEKLGKPVQEQNLLKEQLSNQEVVFSANVTGLAIFKHIDNHPLATTHSHIDMIKQQLGL